MRRLYVLGALILLALLIAGGVSFWFEVKFATIFTSLVVTIKKLNLWALAKWIFRVAILKMPQRFLTSLLRRYVGDHIIIDWIKVGLLYLRDRWMEKFRYRLVIVSVMAGIGAIFATSIGVFILVIFGVDELIEVFWRFIWPTISETALIQAVGRMYERAKRTRIGRFLIAVDAWLDVQVRQRIDRASLRHKELLRLRIEEVLTHQLKTQRNQPIQKRHHEHLLEGSSVQKYRHNPRHIPRRKHSRPPPRPR